MGLDEEAGVEGRLDYKSCFEAGEGCIWVMTSNSLRASTATSFERLARTFDQLRVSLPRPLFPAATYHSSDGLSTPVPNQTSPSSHLLS